MIKIRKFKRSDTFAVAKLIRDTYHKFNYLESPKKYANWYISMYKPTKNPNLIENFLKTPFFYVATDDNKIIGMIRGRKYKKRRNCAALTNLFVYSKYHGIKVGKALIEKFETEVKKKKFKEIHINASIFATPIYQHLGYKKTTGIRNMKGVNVQPLLKKI